MVTLLYIEKLTGLPLVLAAVKALSNQSELQLALAFLASNLLPALLLSPFLRLCLAWLARALADREGGCRR